MTSYLVQQIIHVQAIVSVVLLVGFLVATTLLQQRTMMRSTEVLQTAPQRVTQTDLYASALAYFKRRQVPNLFTSTSHLVPVWFLILVVFTCSIATFFGAEYFADATTPSYVLGGAYATGSHVADAGLMKYQSGTVFVGSMAFLGAYIWTIATLMNRINNNDTNPTTYYYLSIRILTACLVAGIARHMAEAVPFLRDVISLKSDPEGFPVGLAVLGFLIGWNPTLWIQELLNQGAKLFKLQTIAQRQAAQQNLPQDMALTMVQGMADDKIERLMELDVDNCQKLAEENAIILWLRTSYNLELITDWVAQAQLCTRFEDDKVESLRRVGIRDIFDYVAAIANDPALTAVQGVLQIPLGIITNHATEIAADPAYKQLQQLRTALLPLAASPPPP
jgi:hypothetical protein